MLAKEAGIAPLSLLFPSRLSQFKTKFIMKIWLIKKN